MQDASKVIVPGHGRIFLGATDSLPPGQLIQITGSPTAATVTITINSVASAATALSFTTATQVGQAANCTLLAQAIAAMSSVGAGKVYVFPGQNLYTFFVLLDPTVTSPTISVSATYTGGTSPAITAPTTGHGSWTPWTETGHTSPDTPLQVNRSGGDVTQQNSWQANGIDSSTAAITFVVAFSLLQYDTINQRLYYGANAALGADGALYINPAGPTATASALFLIINNGGKAQWRWWANTNISAADSESFDITKLADMPIQAAVQSSLTLANPFAISQTGAAA